MTSQIRTLYGPVSMEIAQHWPVVASYNELSIYACVQGGRIPTEAELRLFYDKFAVGYAGGANVGFRNWHPVPYVFCSKVILHFTAERLISLSALRQGGRMMGAGDIMVVFGSGLRLCLIKWTVLCRPSYIPGKCVYFRSRPSLDAIPTRYSMDFFDGHHYVVVLSSCWNELCFVLTCF
jgi:hypothetical protein